MLRIWISLFLRKHCLMCSAIGMFSDTKLDHFTSIITSWTEPEQTVYPEVHPLRKKNSVFTGWKISWTHRIVAVFNWVTVTHSHYVQLGRFEVWTECNTKWTHSVHAINSVFHTVFQWVKLGTLSYYTLCQLLYLYTYRYCTVWIQTVNWTYSFHFETHIVNSMV